MISFLIPISLHYHCHRRSLSYILLILSFSSTLYPRMDFHNELKKLYVYIFFFAIDFFRKFHGKLGEEKMVMWEKKKRSNFFFQSQDERRVHGCAFILKLHFRFFFFPIFIPIVSTHFFFCYFAISFTLFFDVYYATLASIVQPPLIFLAHTPTPSSSSPQTYYCFDSKLLIQSTVITKASSTKFSIYLSLTFSRLPPSSADLLSPPLSLSLSHQFYNFFFFLYFHLSSFTLFVYPPLFNHHPGK